MKRIGLLLCLLPALAMAGANDELVDRHLKDGMKLLEKGRTKDAMAEFKVAQALAPVRTDVAEAIKRAETGAPATLPLATSVPTPVSDAEIKAKLQGALKEARDAYRESDLNTAKSAWNRALLLDKSSAEAKEGLARLADEAYKKDPDAPFDSSVAELYEAALREARKDHLVEARKKLAEAQSLNPSQAAVKALISKIESGAFAQAGLRRADEALREAERALQAGEWAAARRAYDEALSLRPGDTAAADGLKRLKAKSQGAVDELLAKASKATDDRSALSYIKAALEIAPDDASIMERFKKAEARVQKSEGAASAKARANALYNQGVEAWQAGQLALASERFKQVLELTPADAEAQKALETVHAKLSTQIDRDRADAISLVKEAKSLEAKGKLKDALDAYQRASAKDNSLAEASGAVDRLKKETQEK